MNDVDDEVPFPIAAGGCSSGNGRMYVLYPNIYIMSTCLPIALVVALARTLFEAHASDASDKLVSAHCACVHPSLPGSGTLTETHASDADKLEMLWLLQTMWQAGHEPASAALCCGR